MIRAVIDVGTNSCRLIIVEQQGDQIKTIKRHLLTTRIGQGLCSNANQISPEAMERTLAGLQEFNKILQNYPIAMINVIATQALREATNGASFQTKVKDLLGWQLDIISGDQEAYLSYLGAVSALPDLVQAVVLDIGGGSTEIIVANEAGIHGASTPIGCLRLLEKPISDQRIKETLQKGWLDIEIPTQSTLVAVGGTATTLGAIYLKMAEYDGDALLKCCLSPTDVQDILNRIEEMPLAERTKLPGMLAGREDVLPYGLRILLNVMHMYKLEKLRICDRDLMYGILLANHTL